MNENQLIRILLEKDNYEKFSQYLREFSMLPETWEIIEDIGRYYESYPSSTSVDIEQYITWSRAQNPQRTGDARVAYETQVEVAAGMEADLTVIDRLHELNTAVQVKELCDDIMYRGGTKKMERVASLVDTWREVHAQGGFDDPLAEYDLNDVFTSLNRTGGLSWRLPELNASVGPICKGDMVLVGKRPEVGGTTFLTSEFTHMLHQVPEDGNVVIFNNEESRAHVQARVMQSGLHWTTPQLLACEETTRREWNKFLGTRNLDIIHKTNMTTGFMESILKRREYSLIGINVLWKVRPWGKNLEDFQQYQRVAQWARVMADRYAPVVAIWQADASAEGVEWMDQSQLYGTKTGVQGEADVQIMIGASKDPGKQLERYISIVKNKLPGGPGIKPALRHGKFVVDMDAERGRFVGRMK